MQKNQQVSQLLHNIAALLEEQGVAFKPAAYRKAARTVEDLQTDICAYGDAKKLRELPGIGEAIASKIREFCETGHIKTLDEMLAAQGGLPAELMKVENLGPKRVRQLQMLGITTVEQLVQAAKEGKLRDLPRFSELMEKKIAESAGRVEERSMRFPREEIKGDAELLLSTIKKVPGVERAEIAGSFRRKKATVGDLDIIVVTKDAARVSDAIANLPIVQNVVAHGDTKLSFDVAITSSEFHLRTDVRFVKASQWGSALLYFTGDKEHNITLRKKAIAKGWKLNEYGLFEGEKAKPGVASEERSRVIASKEEKDIYKALGVEFVEPDKRTGVIE